MYQEEIQRLSGLATGLLQYLEPEPFYVKEYIEKQCDKIKQGGWFEQEGDRPWLRTFERNKYILKVAFVHARKGEHITGADLAFELKDKKVVFVQSKRVGSDGRIHFNRFQLQKLIELEGQISGISPLFHINHIDIREWIEIVHHLYHRFEKYYSNKLPPFVPAWFFLPSYYLPFRVTFYHLIITNQQQTEERFFHTSEISFTLAGGKSVSQKEFLNHGLKSDEFQRMFWECKIGGPDIREDIKKDVLYLYSLVTNRFIIWLDIKER